MDDEGLARLTARLGALISDDDSVRIYVMCAKCEKGIRVLGTGKVTEDENVYIL